MAKKVPLIFNTTANRIEELALVDDLDLINLDLVGTTTGTLKLSATPPSTSNNHGFLSVGPTLSFDDTNKIATLTHNVDSYAQVILQNKFTGTTASADFVVNNDRAGGTSTYGDFGINSSTFAAGGAFGDIDGTYLYGAGGSLAVGTFGANDFKVGTNNTVRLSVLSTGQVQLASGSLLGTQTAGAVEYDGTHFYATPTTTSGRGQIPALQTFRLTSNGTNIQTIANYFGATSSINLAANSVYDFEAVAITTINTTGSITWTLTASSAPTTIGGLCFFNQSGLAAGNSNAIYTGARAGTTATFAGTGNITNATTAGFHFKVMIHTNLATTFTLQATKTGGGTLTPLAGSFYTVRQISGNAGSFA